MSNNLNNGEAYTQPANIAQFYLNYSRAYFDAFRIKANRLEIWPILFSIKNLANKDEITIDIIDVIIKDEYEMLLSPHVIKSRLLGLFNEGYVNLIPKPSSINDIKSNTVIHKTDKFSKGFSIHASECAWRLLSEDEKTLYSQDLEPYLNDLIHNMVRQHRREWCLFVKNHLMKFCVIKNVVKASDFRRKISNEDVYWMAILSAWRNYTSSNENEGFTFDDMNHWLNRRSYVATEVTRDVLQKLTNDLELFKSDKIGACRIYRIQDYAINLLIEHSKNLEAIRDDFNNSCKTLLSSKHRL